MKIFLILTLFILGIILAIWYGNSGNYTPQKTISSEEPILDKGTIKYVAIGDSYTIGLGVEESDRWPNILTKHLNEAGINVKLVLNPAISGYEVEDATKIELPQLEKIKPDFVTVLIGANDNFRHKDVKIFREDLINLLDKLKPLVKSSTNIVLITLPDYTKSPAGVNYKSDKKATESIEQYNMVIKDEANKRELKVADIFPISQTMTGLEDYISDGLHPSKTGYSKWEKVIFPVVEDLLKKISL